MPQKKRTSPPKLRTAAVISWRSTFISGCIWCRILSRQMNETIDFSKFCANIYQKRDDLQIFVPIFSQILSHKGTITLPCITEEGVNIGFRNRLAGDFAEAVHQQLQVLGRNVLPCPMVESVMDFLCSHND